MIKYLACGLLVLTAACSGSDTIGLPGILTTNPFAAVRLNVRAAVMATVAPYDTLQLVPTAYAIDGTQIPLPGPITYTVSDTTVSVSATGLLKLKSKTSNTTYIIVRVQDTTQNVTKADTVFVLGTTTVPKAPIASYSIQPAGKDSAVIDVNGGTKTLTVTALDANQSVIPTASLVSHFRSSDLTLATVVARSGVVTGVYPGTLTMTATTTYYGVTKTDSLRFTVGYPDVNIILEDYTKLVDGTVQYYFSPATWVVGVNKAVIFESMFVNYDLINSYTDNYRYNTPVLIAFDDPSTAQPAPIATSILAANFAANGSGNISLTVPDSIVAHDSVDQYGSVFYPLATTYCESAPFSCAAARSFSSPGTYHYHDTQTGATGVITVVGP